MTWFRAVRDSLKTEWPAKHPVSVRVIRGLVNHGDCCLLGKGKDRRFLIRIRRDSQTTMVHFLLHEWAHALAWEQHGTQDHPDAWGKAHAKIYRWLHDD